MIPYFNFFLFQNKKTTTVSPEETTLEWFERYAPSSTEKPGFVDGIKAKINETIHNAKAQGEDYMNQAKSKVDDVKEQINNTIDDAKSTASKLVDKAQQKVEGVKSDIGDFFDGLKAKFGFGGDKSDSK